MKRLIALLAGGLLVACGGERDDGIAIEVAPAAVQIAVEARGELQAVSSTPLSVPGSAWSPRQLVWLLPEGSLVKEGDLIARFESVRGQVDLDKALLDIERNALARAAKRAELSLQDGRNSVDLAQVDTDLGIATRYADAVDLGMFALNQMLDTVQDRTYLEQRRSLLDWQREQAETRGAAELAVLDSQRETQGKLAEQRRGDMAALELRAPHDGVMLLVANWSGEKPREGAHMFAGNELARLPDTRTLEVELVLPQAEAEGVAVGQRVRLHPVGRPEQAVDSELNWIAAAPQVRSRESPVKYLSVKAAVPAEAAQRHGWVPGQAFAGRIVFADEADALAVPSLALRNSERGTVVRVLARGGIEERTVEIGPRNGDVAIVRDGLRAGDRVLLAGESSTGEGS